MLRTCTSPERIILLGILQCRLKIVKCNFTIHIAFTYIIRTWLQNLPYRWYWEWIYRVIPSISKQLSAQERSTDSDVKTLIGFCGTNSLQMILIPNRYIPFWYAEYLCSLPKVILRDVRSQSSRRGLRMEADPLSIWMWAWKISGYSSLNQHFSAMHKYQEKVSRKVDCHSSNWVAGLGKQMDGLEY